jgi:hypothetical protein
MLTELQTTRDSLALIPGVASCKIGIEQNLSPADYPMIRLVPARIIAGRPYQERECETFIYFGAATANSVGLEQVYADLFQLEAEILSLLKLGGHRYRETITDEDRLDAYKLMVIRCDILLTNAPTVGRATVLPTGSPGAFSGSAG